ncbi:MAG: histidine phosphatase family protein [Pseudonocardiaceae bacterium]
MPDLLPRGRGVPALAAALSIVGTLALTACAGTTSTGTTSTGTTSTGAQSATTARPAPSAADGDGLLAQLRGGGAIIVIRHAATDRSQPDADERTGPGSGPVDFDDCSTQRNLTDEGRAGARTIGAAFRELRIPVGTVWTSPYCRSRETAELAFGRAEVIDGLERLYPRPDEVAERRINQLIREQAPGRGDPNMVISGHGVYPSVLEPAVTLGEGDAALYALHGDDVVLLGQVAPDEWAGLD